MNPNASELPYTTRVEFSPGRGRFVRVFQDKTIPLTVSFPLPDAYGDSVGNIPHTSSYQYCDGIDTVLSLIYLEQRGNILREFQQQQAAIAGQKNSAIAGALLGDPNSDPPEGA